MKKIEIFKVEGDMITRMRRHCPKCGSGVFLAEHKNRYSCGHCGYTEFKPSRKEQAAKPVVSKAEEKPEEASEQPKEEEKTEEKAPVDEKPEIPDEKPSEKPEKETAEEPSEPEKDVPAEEPETSRDQP